MEEKDKNIEKELDNFLDNGSEECTDEEICKIPRKDGLIERVNKRLITDDGRELLM